MKRYKYKPIKSFEVIREFQEGRRADTYLGTCIKSTGGKYIGVRKTFSKENTYLFYGAVIATSLLRFVSDIRKICPKITYFDFQNLTYYMKYIEGVTLESYIRTFPFDGSRGNISKFHNVVGIGVHKLLRVLEKHKVLHRDLHTENMIVLKNNYRGYSIFLIDIDELDYVSKKGNDPLSDRQECYSHIELSIRSAISKLYPSDPKKTTIVNKYMNTLLFWKKT